MKQVVILSGVPGSGKSTLADRLIVEAGGGAIVSADHLFTGPDGYKFDPSKIGEAHQECWRRFYTALRTPVLPLVVVDNTNLTAAEIAPYVLPAEALGASVRIMRVECDLVAAFARQTHGVPEHAFLRMADLWRKPDFVPWWTVERVDGQRALAPA